MKYFVLTFQGQSDIKSLVLSYIRCLIFEVRQGPLKREKLRGYSSAGRAPALQAGGHRFDPDYLHQMGERTRAKRQPLKTWAYSSAG